MNKFTTKIRKQERKLQLYYLKDTHFYINMRINEERKKERKLFP